MPQLDPTFYPTQLFWLLITFAVLYLVLWKMVLPRIGEVLEARQDHIDADLEKAAALKDDSVGVLAEYERALAEARDRATAALKRASDEMAAESAERHEAFGRDLAQKTKEAEARIAAAKEAALGHLKAVAAEVAGAATAKLIGIEVPAAQAQAAVEGVMRRRD
ncbi:MAG: F0F1 ATP synthase subunit B' [Kiloniellaceae bacterium]